MMHAWATLIAAAPENRAVKVETKDGCQIHHCLVPSPSMQRDIRVIVVLPPNYAANDTTRYPVLHALHGMGAPYASWSEMPALRRALKEMPMIVTCMDGDEAGWYLNATQKPDSQFRTFFFDELIPWLAENYRVSGQRAVTGFSMGGFGAMAYAFDQPQLFSSASSLSGAFYPMDAAAAHPRITHALAELLGSYAKNAAAYAERDIYNRLERHVANGQRIPPLMLRCGTEEMLLAVNRSFVDFLAAMNARIRERVEPQVEGIEDKRERRRALYALMDKAGIDFTYVETSGAHDWTYWKSQAGAIMAFHWKHFQENVL